HTRSKRDWSSDVCSSDLAREVVNRVQRLRKQAGFHVADRIVVAFATGDAALGSAIEAHGAMIARETLAVAYEAAAAPEGEAVERSGERRGGGGRRRRGRP